MSFKDLTRNGSVINKRAFVSISLFLPLLSGMTRASGEAFSIKTAPGYSTVSVQACTADAAICAGSGTVDCGGSNCGREALYWTPSGMTVIGDLAGGALDSGSEFISSDGSVVVGWGTTDTGRVPFRWTAADGLQALGALPGDLRASASGMTPDGAVVVGSSYNDSIDRPFRAFRWTMAEGMQELDLLPGMDAAIATDVSADGLHVVGRQNGSSGYTAVRWTVGGGIQPLFSGAARAISADGSIVAGGASASFSTSWIRWTEAAGAQTLGPFPVAGYTAGIHWMSEDGDVIVGNADDGGGTENGFRIFRWSSARGFEDLAAIGHTPGEPFPDGIGSSFVYDVSADGEVIVGFSNLQAMVWDRVNGMRYIRDIVEDAGYALPYLTVLYESTHVSPDGSVIHGWGHVHGVAGSSVSSCA